MLRCVSGSRTTTRRRNRNSLERDQFSSFHSPWIICISTPTLLSLLPPSNRCVNGPRLSPPLPRNCTQNRIGMKRYIRLIYTYIFEEEKNTRFVKLSVIPATRGDCYNDHEFFMEGKTVSKFSWERWMVINLAERGSNAFLFKKELDRRRDFCLTYLVVYRPSDKIGYIQIYTLLSFSLSLSLCVR